MSRESDLHPEGVRGSEEGKGNSQGSERGARLLPVTRQRDEPAVARGRSYLLSPRAIEIALIREVAREHPEDVKDLERILEIARAYARVSADGETLEASVNWKE